jgi:Flp pilus assembly protein TadB
MRTLWITCLVWFTGYLAISPLPAPKKLLKFRFAPYRFQRNTQVQIKFEEQLQFLYCLRTQLLSGATQNAALQFALSRIDETLLTETRKCLSLQSGIYDAMKQDSMTFEFRTFGDYALLMQAGAVSGASILQPLSSLISALVRNRTQEQLITTELASTKATVLVLAGLPIIGACLAMMLGSHSLEWLLTTGAGHVCLLIGFVLELLGWLWIQRLITTAVRDPA